MSKELLKVTMIASIITNYYQKLSDLILSDEEDSEEYKIIIEKIKEIKEIEKQEYNKIDLKTINDYFKNSNNNNPIEDRIADRLSERYDVIMDEPRINDEILLSSAIDGKIIIDTLKIVEKRINSIKKEIPDEENFNCLIKYYQVSKLTYLTSTSYLESLALKNNFNVEKMPDISIEDINEVFDINLINDYSEVLHYNIFTGLNALYEINEKDEILNTYLALIELARIEAILSYLDKKTLNNVEKSFNNTYCTSKKEQINTAKRLINQRKNEINKKGE